MEQPFREDDTERLARIRRVLLRIAIARQVPPADCEDVVQDALFALSKALGPMESSQDIAGLAIDILEKRIADYFRRRKRYDPRTVAIEDLGEEEPAAPDVEQAYARQEALARIDRAAAAVLSLSEHEIYEMTKQGYTCYEIAEARGVDPDTITCQQSNVRKKLTEAIEKETARRKRMAGRSLVEKPQPVLTPGTDPRQPNTKIRREKL